MPYSRKGTLGEAEKTSNHDSETWSGTEPQKVSIGQNLRESVG